MIDIHCHILPAFDDGSTSMGESLAMARMAAASGVTGIVTTPHFPGEPSSIRRVKALLDHYAALELALQQAEIPIKLYLGAEILCLPETLILAQNHALPTIGDTNYLLMEFHFGESGSYMTQMLEILMDSGYRPIIAHPERFAAVQQDPRLARHWFEEMGIVLQMNKGSILGAFGGRVQQTAHHLLEQGLIHLIASDAHGADRRTPHMGQLRQWLDAHCSAEYAEILLERNPARVVEGRPMVSIGRR